jgi:Holliday junction DNA helicase RuvA
MIARLKGLVDQIGEDWAVIDVGGVGYLVYCSSRTLSRLPRVGEAAALFIETHVREDHIHLFGFFEETERAWFRLLQTVQGVGSKVALAILSTLTANDLANAIAGGDKAMLSRPSGVGPKLAARLATELKDKVAGIAAPGSFAPALATATAGLEDAVSALVNLGYRRLEAQAAVVRASATLGEGAQTAALIRVGLQELGKELTR